MPHSVSPHESPPREVEDSEILPDAPASQQHGAVTMEGSEQVEVKNESTGTKLEDMFNDDDDDDNEFPNSSVSNAKTATLSGEMAE